MPKEKPTPSGSMTKRQASELTGVPESDILNFKDYGNRVVVVTHAGRKIEAPIGVGHE